MADRDVDVLELTPAGRLLNAFWFVVAVGVAATYFSTVFRFFAGIAWTSGLGDWLDPYFGNVILEHWYRSLLAFRDPTSPPMFFPTEGARYSHGLVLYAPIYTVARLFSHPFVANTLMLFVVMLVGSSCLYLALRRIGLRSIEALVFTICFFSSPNLINGATVTWAQRASVFLIPVSLLVLLVVIKLPKSRTRLAFGGLAGLLGSLMFAQDFYTAILGALVLALMSAPLVLYVRRRDLAWLFERLAAPVVAVGRTVFPSRPPSPWWLVLAGLGFVLAVAIAAYPVERTTIGAWSFSARQPWRPFYVGLLAASWYAARAIIRRLSPAVASRPPFTVTGDSPPWVARLHKQLPLTAAVTCGGLLGVLVFLWIYLGPYLEFPAFPPEQLRNALREPNVARWSDLVSSVRSLQSYDSLRPFVVVLGLVLIVVASPAALARWVRIHTAWVVVVSMIVFAMPLRFGEWFPWSTFFGWLPGMSAVRDPKRIIYLYELAVPIVAAIWLTRFRKGAPERVVAVLFVGAITWMDWSARGLPYGREISVFNQWVRSPIQIDPSCRSFFIKGASDVYMSRSGHMWSLYAVDATFIALDHDIPTLNGYAAWAPEFWNLANPQDGGYPRAVDEWIERHGLRDTCELDIEARTMTPHLVGPPRP